MGSGFEICSFHGNVLQVRQVSVYYFVISKSHLLRFIMITTPLHIYIWMRYSWTIVIFLKTNFYCIVVFLLVVAYFDTGKNHKHFQFCQIYITYTTYFRNCDWNDIVSLPLFNRFFYINKLEINLLIILEFQWNCVIQNVKIKMRFIQI